MAGGFVAGSIVAMLNLDKTGWNQSVKQVQNESELLKKKFGTVSEAAAKTGKAFAVAGGVIVGSLLGIVKKTADMGDSFNDMSKRTGVSVEVLSSFKLAADQSGTSIEGLGRGMQKLAINMNEANTGNKGAADKFKALGVSVADASGRLRPMDEVMMDVADKFAGMKDGAQKTALAFDIFGKTGVELIPMLNQGRDGLKASREEAERLGIVFSTQAAQASDEFNDKLAALKLGLGGAAKELGMSLMPAVGDMVKKITDIVVQIKEWIKAHPELAKQLGGIALKIGGLMLVLGPVLIIVPKIVTAFQLWGKMLPKMGLDIKGLSAPISGIGGVLKGLPLIAAAAFAGWNIGKLIGEVTGLDHVIEGLTTKIINKFGLWKGAGDIVITNTDRVAKQQKLLADASEKAGVKIDNVITAMKVMNGEMVVQDGHLVRVTKSTKDAGTAAKDYGDLLTKYGIQSSEDTSIAIAALKKDQDDLTAAYNNGTIPLAAYKDGMAKTKEEMDKLTLGAEASKTAVKTWGERMEEYGVTPLKNKKQAIGDLLGDEERLGQLLKDGKIDSTEYGQGIVSINDKLKELGATTKTLVLPPSRELGEIWKQAPGTMSSMVYSLGSLDADMKSYADSVGMSVLSVQAFMYEIGRMQLLILGIHVPPLDQDFKLWGPAAVETTSVIGQAFDTLWSNVASGFGQTFQDILSGATSMKDALGQIWGNIEDAFFSMCGEIVTKWVKGVLTDIVSGAAKAAGDAASNIAKTATSAVSGISGILSGGLAPAIGSFVGTFLAGVLGGGPSGHQQQQQINDTKDSRNFLAEIRNWFFSAGAGFGGASYEFITGHVGDWLTWINDSVKVVGNQIADLRVTLHGDLLAIDKSIKGIKGAAAGAVVTEPQLMMLHGTASAPEYVIPSANMDAILQAAPKVTKSGSTVNLQNTVNLNGTMVTDRDYVRGRLLKEIGAALRAGFGKSELKAILGV